MEMAFTRSYTLQDVTRGKRRSSSSGGKPHREMAELLGYLFFASEHYVHQHSLVGLHQNVVFCWYPP